MQIIRENWSLGVPDDVVVSGDVEVVVIGDDVCRSTTVVVASVVRLA